MTRDELILSTIPAVDLLTRRYRYKYWYQDLRASVLLRVTRAAGRYDPAKAKFSTFIGYHIRGAIMDYKESWARRERLRREGSWRCDPVRVASWRRAISRGMTEKWEQRKAA